MDRSAPLSEAQWRLWRRFQAVHSLLAREVDGRLRRGQDLAPGEYGALALVYESPDRRLRIGQIADGLGWERSRVSHLLARMGGRGLVTRREHPEDARGTEVSLTPEGARRLLRAVRQHSDDLRQLFFDRLSAEEQLALGAVLDRLLDAGAAGRADRGA